MRIVFVLPNLPVATGGLRVAVRFARQLRDDGYDIAVATDRPRRWRKAVDTGDLPHVSIGAMTRSAAADSQLIAVVPEILTASRWCTTFPGWLVVLNQNPYLTGPAVVDPTYESDRALGVIATSRYTESYLRVRFPGVRTARVTLGVDPVRFAPRPRPPGQYVMSWMPRKRHNDAELVLEVLRRRYASRPWLIKPIDGLSQSGVADALATSHVFLAFGEREGFGLPLAEAMSCRAACVGFTGVGGDELLTSKTGWPVAEGDIVGYIEAVEHVTRLVELGDERLVRVTDAASRTVAKNYSMEMERSSLLSAFRILLARDAA